MPLPPRPLEPPVRRAKIVATIGPALDDRDRLKAALQAGVDVVRLNFSHGDHETHARRLAMVREIAEELGRNIGSLADLQGPKIRLGILPDDGVPLTPGGEVTLVPGHEELDGYADDEGHPRLPVVYDALAHDVHPGGLILVDDGSIRLVVAAVLDGEVRARVVAGTLAKSRKGVNLPGIAVSAPSLTEKDLEDLRLAVELECDWIALSFVRRPEDLQQAKQHIEELGGQAPVVAKLEREEAVDDLSEVVLASDAVMVARGDLGVEIGPERVPALQKDIIHKANEEARPVITATEMLESMIESPRPTRAEANDVANAIFDGTDAVMLSAETAAGRYPVEAIRTMARIIEVAESTPTLLHPFRPHQEERRVARVVAGAACQVAEDVGAVAIAVYSLTGSSLQMISTFRPPTPVVGLTPDARTLRRAALLWGAEATTVPVKHESTQLVESAERTLVEQGYATTGDRIVVVSGVPGVGGSTNRIMVHTIGDPFDT